MGTEPVPTEVIATAQSNNGSGPTATIQSGATLENQIPVPVTQNPNLNLIPNVANSPHKNNNLLNNNIQGAAGSLYADPNLIPNLPIINEGLAASYPLLSANGAASYPNLIDQTAGMTNINATLEQQQQQALFATEPDIYDPQNLALNSQLGNLPGLSYPDFSQTGQLIDP